jgi:hypothetical protein
VLGWAHKLDQDAPIAWPTTWAQVTTWRGVTSRPQPMISSGAPARPIRAWAAGRIRPTASSKRLAAFRGRGPSPRLSRRRLESAPPPAVSTKTGVPAASSNSRTALSPMPCAHEPKLGEILQSQPRVKSP